MSSTETPPKGYWLHANGSFIPENKVKAVDKERHKVVTGIVAQAKQLQDDMRTFKENTMNSLADFIAKSLEEYDVKVGGTKGNVTLLSYDGKFKIVRAMEDRITFDERLQAAKALIDECIQRWSKGSNNNIKVLVLDAFQVDKAGKINVDRVLGLRRLKIDDETWDKAMDAISDSVSVVSTKAYVRFYEQKEDGSFAAIPLDIANL